MSRTLDTWQRNMLIVGNTLGIEIPAPSAGHRAFFYVRGYSIDPARHGRPSIFLNADHSDLRFTIRAFEIPVAYMTGWDADHFERDLAKQDAIVGLDTLEDILTAYLDDFSHLVSYTDLDY